MGLKAERRRESVPLFTNDDKDRLAELVADMEKAAVTAGPARINDTPVVSAARAYDEFKAEATERATLVHLTAIPGRQWRDMLAQHPPREDVVNPEGKVIESYAQDQGIGFNVDTMSRPLAIACIDLDQFDDEAERDDFVDDLSDPDFAKIVSAAVRVNTEGGPDPKFSASSWLEQTSAAMSSLPESSEAASARSSDSPTRIGDSSEPTG